MKLMERRDFLRLAALSGLSVVTPLRGARAEEGAGSSSGLSEPPYYMFFHAGGGWDPTSLCDPKGRANEEEESPVNMFFTDEIGTAGNIRYAPVAYNETFFQKHYQKLLVVNGLDMQTNNHSVGVRHAWSGKVAEGYPSLAALIAGVTSVGSPLAYVSFGGYDFTAGTVAPTRLGNLGVVERIAQPNIISPGDKNIRRFHSDATFDRILAAQQKRREYLEGQKLLPKARKNLSQLFWARSESSEIKLLSEYLPEELDDNSLKRQVQLSMAGFRSGLSKTANLQIGGFDTHGDHDARHFPRLEQLMQAVDFAWDEAERQGIADELVIVVGSDFARTPHYNSGNGKDHWSISSMMLMGKGIQGNRVIGATTHKQEAKNVDPETLQVVEDGGVRLEPAHIHRALRELAGILDDDLAQLRFPLVGAQPLPLLG